MFIEIKDLEINPVDFREEFSPGLIDLGEEVRQRSPLCTSGRVDLVEEHHGKHQVVRDIRVKGKLETSLGSALRALPRSGRAPGGAQFRSSVPAAGNRLRPRGGFR